MKQWEYMDVAVHKTEPASTIPLLDEAGKLGWETTGIVDENHHYRIYLMKRPLGEEPTKTDARAPMKHSHSISFPCNVRCPHRGTEQEITINSATYA